MFRSDDGISRRTALQKGGIVLGSSIIGLSSVSGTAVAAPTEIDECTSIDEPGEYVLTNDLSAEGDCLGIAITTSNVTIDGNGHTISGNGTDAGIVLDGSAVIRNLTIENFERGIGTVLTSNEITLENTVVSDNLVGVEGGLGHQIDIRDSTIRDNGIGINPGEGSQLSITQSTLSGNDNEAVSTSLGHSIEVENSTVRANGAGIATGEGLFADNTISNNDGYGIRLIGLVAPADLGTATIVGNDIQGNAGPGIEFTASSGLVRENTIANNQNGIVLSGVPRDGSFPTSRTPSYELTTNNIENNDEFGIQNNADPVAVATCNYWGDRTGPEHEDNPRENPKGDSVSDDVAFVPWSVDRIQDGEGTCIGGRTIGDFQEPPTDPDGDGLYEDINGDGESDIVDVQALFTNLDDETIRSNPDAFDFNGDSSVNVVDVQKLFSEMSN